MKFLYPSLVAFSVAVLSCKEGKKEPDRKPDPPTIVDVVIAKKQQVSDFLEVNGTIVAKEYTELHPEVSGRLTYLNIPEGAFVKQGTLLARIYDQDLRAQVLKSQAALELAQKTEQRLSKLLAIQGVNQADYDAAVNAISSNKADIAYTEAQITKTYIKAPFSGTLGLRQVSIGAFITPTTIIASIQQTSQLRIDFTLPEEYSSLIKRGNTVQVQLDAGSTRRATATIIATEPSVDINTRNLKVRAELRESTSNVGAFVKVYINAKRDQGAIMVPTNCIIPNDINKQLVVVRGGKAIFTDVQTGLREANNVEITKGLNPGDTVVVTGVLFARPNSPLRVRKVMNEDKVANAGAQ